MSNNTHSLETSEPVGTLLKPVELCSLMQTLLICRDIRFLSEFCSPKIHFSPSTDEE